MATEEITDYIRSAFEYKELKNYKKAVDYFYKALTMDSNSSEIMCELAFLYEKLNNVDSLIYFIYIIEEVILWQNTFTLMIYQKEGN